MKFGIGTWIQLVTLICIFVATGPIDHAKGDDHFERAGLVNEWFTHLDVGGRSRIVNMQIQVNEDVATSYYLVEYGKHVERISENDLDAFGNRRGIDGDTGAKLHAETRREILTAELAAQGRSDVEVKIRQITLPKTTIYTATSRGLVAAIDADTGEHLWHTKVGKPKYFTTGVGASKKHVAVTNGSTVYCLSADEGRILWSRNCRRAPNHAPSVGEYSIFVPLVDGRLQVFSIEGKGSFPRTLVSYGTAISKPLLTDSTVSWATDDGFYSVAPYRASSISFRLNSGDEMAAGGSAGDGVIYVNTTSGSIFALDEERGSILWEYLTGDRITSAPFVKGNGVFVVSAEHRLYKIDSTTGLPAKNWEKPISGFSEFVGASQNRIYMLDKVGHLTAIDPETGTQLATVEGTTIRRVIPNRLTDRLYVSTAQGLIRCYRETGNPYPVFRADEEEMLAEKMDKKKEEAKMADEDDPFATDDDDPFAADDDPFATDDDDPFAADDSSDDPADDPFAGDGSSDSSNDDDPFASGGDSDDSGSSDDPFASGGSDDNSGDSGDDDDPFGGI